MMLSLGKDMVLLLSFQNLEIEPFAAQRLVAALVEPEKPGGAVGNAALFARLGEEAHGQEALPEVPLVERPPEDRLVQRLELRQLEPLGQHLEADRLVADLRAQALERDREDLVVVEREAARVLHGKPARRARVGSRLHAVIREVDQRVVRDRHDAARADPDRLALNV